MPRCVFLLCFGIQRQHPEFVGPVAHEVEELSRRAWRRKSPTADAGLPISHGRADQPRSPAPKT
jgi:hypothetical protein